MTVTTVEELINEPIEGWMLCSPEEKRARRLLYEVLGEQALRDYIDHSWVKVKVKGGEWIVGATHAVLRRRSTWGIGKGTWHRCVFAYPPEQGRDFYVSATELPLADRVLSMAIQARSNKRFWSTSRSADCSYRCPLWIR